jgi:hypothetical protein
MSDLEDLPLVESARLGRRVSEDSAVADAYTAVRPDTDRFLTSATFSIGLQMMDLARDRLYPSPAQLKAMRAAGWSYTTYGTCGPYDYNATCEEACFGFAPHHMDPFYCATCPEQAADPVNNPAWNWHYVGFRGQIQYMDREPDVCAGKDAWKWTFNHACGNCRQSAVFRCHDGYKKYPNAASWDPTICQGLVACDNRLMLC